MATDKKHICVCICTFKRPEMLKRLLGELEHQKTEGLFTCSIVVVDNDSKGSAMQTVQAFRQESGLDVRYYVEPEQNISLARNKSVENARGDLIAMIDDDEFPGLDWLLVMYRALCEFHADGILGPVLPYYETKPPEWIIKGGFYEKPLHKTGTVLNWTNTRTSNVLLKRDIFEGENNKFLPEFGSGGEDKDFFRRMINRGFQFIWCNEAPVFEAVPPERWTRSFMLRRALLRGRIPYNNNFAGYFKSLVAIPLYTLILPILLFTGHHIFMKYLIKDCDHIGRILSLLGISVIKDKYVTK